MKHTSLASLLPLLCLEITTHNTSLNIFREITIDVFCSIDIAVTKDMVAHGHWLKFCYSIICVCFNSLSRVARACLFGGLGTAVRPVMPRH